MQMYYNHCDDIIAILGRSPALQKVTLGVLEAILSHLD